MEPKKKLLKTASHYRQLMSERINRLRSYKPKDLKEEIEIARAIAYLSSVALTAIKDGDMEDRVKRLEEMIENE